MAQVSVSIGGRKYRLACNEGEEAHLEGLARQIDGKIEEIRGAFGEIGDQRLVVMAALTFADELSEARGALDVERRRVEAAEGAERAARAAAAQRTEEATRRLDEVSFRLETLTATLAEPPEA